MHRHGHGGHHTAAAARVLVIDNGAGNIKLGFAGDEEPQLQLPNCVAKAKGERSVLVGPALLEARDISGLTVKRPYDRGFLVNWELERDIWSTAFKALAAAISGGGPKQPGTNPSSSSSSSGAGLDYSTLGLALTEPLFNFPAVQALTEEVVFEEFGFASLYAAPGPWYTMNAPPVALFPGDTGATGGPNAATQAALAAGAGVVVDAGFSSVTVSPFFQGQLLEGGVQRLNLGGKALTNLLKETVSYRSLNMADEGVLMERVKEELCWVSQAALVDLKRSQAGVRSPHRREYVLPDGVHNLRGYVRPAAGPTAAAVAAAQQAGQALGPWPECPEQQAATEAAKAAAAAASREAGGEGGGGEGGAKARKGQQVVDQVLVLNNELFMVPEALFRPSDIGLQQQGVPELVAAALASVHPALAPLLAGRVVVTGGCAALPGFCDRLAREARALVPQEYDLQVVQPQDPGAAAWTAASAWAVQPGRYAAAATTRQQYFETGGSAARRGRGD